MDWGVESRGGQGAWVFFDLESCEASSALSLNFDDVLL